MTKLTRLGTWNKIKGKLKQKYAKLAGDNLLFALGQNEELLGHLQRQAGTLKQKLRASIATLPNHSLHTLNTMKTSLLLLPFALLTLSALPSCREKSTGEKVGDKIDDALDQRPGEKIRDAVEDAKK